MSEVKTGRGRPKQSTNIIEINNIKSEFTITKENDYNSEISYLKVIDKQFKSKLQPIVSQMCDECIVPVWKSEDGFYMLKVKHKWMPHEFEKNEMFTADLNCHYFNMTKDDGNLIQGCYVKLSTNDVTFDTA